MRGWLGTGQRLVAGTISGISSFLAEPVNTPELQDELNRKLIAAVESGNMTRVTALLDQAADQTFVNANGRNAALIAAQQGFTDIYKYLKSREGFNPEAVDKYGRNAALIAASCDRVDTYKYLEKQRGFNPHAVDKQDRNAAMLAAAYGAVNIYTHLERRPGFNPDAVDKQGWNAGLLAAANGKLDMYILLEKRLGFDLDAKDKQGRNAAMLAAAYDRQDIYTHLEGKILFNPDALDTQGRSIADHADSYSNKDEEFINNIRTYKDRIKIQFIYDVKSGDLGDLLYLLRKDPSLVHTEDTNGRNAAILAAAYGQEEIYQHLEGKGCNMNATDHNGWNAALAAAAYDQGDMYTYLAGRPRFNPRLVDNEGNNAADVALAQGHKKLSEYIAELHKIIEENRLANGANYTDIGHATGLDSFRLQSIDQKVSKMEKTLENSAVVSPELVLTIKRISPYADDVVDLAVSKKEKQERSKILNDTKEQSAAHAAYHTYMVSQHSAVYSSAHNLQSGMTSQQYEGATENLNDKDLTPEQVLRKNAVKVGNAVSFTAESLATFASTPVISFAISLVGKAASSIGEKVSLDNQMAEKTRALTNHTTEYNIISDSVAYYSLLNFSEDLNNKTEEQSQHLAKEHLSKIFVAAINGEIIRKPEHELVSDMVRKVTGLTPEAIESSHKAKSIIASSLSNLSPTSSSGRTDTSVTPVTSDKLEELAVSAHMKKGPAISTIIEERKDIKGASGRLNNNRPKERCNVM